MNSIGFITGYMHKGGLEKTAGWIAHPLGQNPTEEKAREWEKDMPEIARKKYQQIIDKYNKK
jgi:hypothetical protein